MSSNRPSGSSISKAKAGWKQAMTDKDNTENSNRMTGAEIVLQALKDNGVEHIFGYPGGSICLPGIKDYA